MGYDRNELVTIGERFAPESLLEWSGELLHAARQDMQRLKMRGITEQFLRDIEVAREEVKKLNSRQEKESHATSPLTLARNAAIDAALDWREEVKGLAKAVFDSNPDGQACFRMGVRTSRSLPKLIGEVGQLLCTLRENLPALRGVGVSENLIARGEEVCRRLDEAQRRQVEEQAQTPPTTTDLHHAEGVLYTRARFLKRVGEIEFRKDGERLGPYSYQSLRAGEKPGEARPAHMARPVPAEIGRRS